MEELGKPFDLIVHGLGPTRHVEVKGSTAMPLAAAELTVNEVADAGNYQPDRPRHRVTSNSTPALQKRLRPPEGVSESEGWTPATASLSPTRYAYDLPAAAAAEIAQAPS